MDYMLDTINLDLEHVKQGGRPGATIIVHQETVVATGVNEIVQSKDPTAHGTIIALRKASYVLKSENLNGCIVYTTLEPCAMCLGALYWAEVDIFPTVLVVYQREEIGRLEGKEEVGE